SSTLMASNCSTSLAGLISALGCSPAQVPVTMSGNVHLIVLAVASFPLAASCAFNAAGNKAKAPTIARIDNAQRSIRFDIFTLHCELRRVGWRRQQLDPSLKTL